jgi:hypothetical protein
MDSSETVSNTLPAPNAGPDFIAGFIMGFTGKNHLEELHTCMTDIDPFITNVHVALIDIKSGDYLHGVESISNIIALIPAAVSGCTDPRMKTDINAIETWAAIFKQPLKLSKTVTKNWLNYGAAIKQDITNE